MADGEGVGRASLTMMIVSLAAACGHAGRDTPEHPEAQSDELAFYVAVVNRCNVPQAVRVSAEEPRGDATPHSIAPGETLIRRLGDDERVWRKSHGEWRSTGWFSDAPADGGSGRVELLCNISATGA